MIFDIKKLRIYHEDILMDRQERLYDEGRKSSEEFIAIEAELDRRADARAKITTRQKEMNEMAEAECLARGKEVAELIDVEDYDTLIAKYGADFIDDYEISNNIVKSNVARDWQESVWTCEDADAAKKKIRQLIGWRIYDHYFR